MKDKEGDYMKKIAKGTKRTKNAFWKMGQ